MDDSSEQSHIGNANQPSIIDDNDTSSLVLATATIDCMVPSLMTKSHILPIIDDCKGSLSVDDMLKEVLVLIVKNLDQCI